jgi:hypothetical protein
LELAAELADGETEVSMLLPRRSYGRAWRRILHDQTADRIIEVVSQLSHVNATIVPFLVARGTKLGQILDSPTQPQDHREKGPAKTRGAYSTSPAVPDTISISDVEWRQRARIAGRVKTVRVQPWSGVSALECVLIDKSGEAITLVFMGRRSIAGIRTGCEMMAEGMVGKHHERLAMINPAYELLSLPEGVE